MNLQLEWSYVTDEDIESFGSRNERIIEFSSNGFIGKFFRSSFQIAAIVEQDTLFVHGGISLEWANKGIEKINQLGASIVEKFTESLSDFERPKQEIMTEEETSLIEYDGPLWNRDFAIFESEYVEKKLDKVLELLKVSFD